MDYYNASVKTGKISVTRTSELNIMIEYLSKKYNLKPSAVLNYCVARVYNKEVMDEERMRNYLDNEVVK